MKFEYSFKTDTKESGSIKIESDNFPDAQEQAINKIAIHYKIKPEQVKVSILYFDTNKIK